MKYAWIEEYVDGDEILDGEGLSYDPPQYEQVGTGNGQVTSLNRGASLETESEGNCSAQELVHGMDSEMYTVVGYEFTPVDETTKQSILDGRQAEKDTQDAYDAVDYQYAVETATPVTVTINDVDYVFAGGIDSSLLINNGIELADNLNETDIELWDIYGEPHIFTKQDAKTIAIAIGLSFRTAYTTRKYARKAIKDGE